jgi:predicted extracellular nuclease/2',3'-cyclic-nucleotide 2'-phosphodiesterase (5'-nucleotidase family)
MPAPRSRRRARIAALVSAALALTGLQFLLAPQAAQASLSTKLSNFPYSQDWSNGALITTNDDWSGVTGVQGYLGQDITTSTGVDPQTLTGESALGNDTDVVAGATVSSTAGGVLEIDSNTVAIQGSGTADAPYLSFHIDLTGQTGVQFAFNAKDLDSSADNATQQVAVQYRVGNSGAFTNLPVGYIADATTASSASQVTARSVPLPADAEGQGDVYVRVMTANAVGNDELVGIDDISIATGTVSPLSLASISDQNAVVGTPISTLQPSASGGVSPYSWSATGLPTGLDINAGTGAITGTPTATCDCNVLVTVTDSTADVPASASQSFVWHVTATTPITAIADIQGTGARSPFAPATGTGQGTDTVTTEGVITALYTKGFASSGAATCGFCGIYIQTGGTGGASDATPGASDGLFVYGTSTFVGKDKDGTDLAVGDSVRVSGKVSEFSGTGDTGSLTELNATSANIAKITALSPVTMQTTLPATYADREAHEGELFQPTDLVITDTFNFEGFGELGLAQDEPLVQPTELCADNDATCITNAQADIKNRGWFVEDGTSTTFVSGATFYRPKNSNNSDVPLPYIDKTHTARVGAQVAYPAGAVLDYRNKKWYVQVPRAVISTHNGTPDLGADVLQIEDTRPANASPADVGGDLKIATYNVENYFSITGQAFADANPYYASSGPGCEWDYDRDDVPTLTFQCTSPQAIPDQWDPVTHAPTHYKPGLVSAPRGAATQASLDRQTAKIVRAINGLGADVVSLEELGNPNKLRMGVTNGPLNPDPTKADGGLGTPIAWRDASISYLVDHLNDAAGAGTWGFVASPEESTDATSVNHMCATVQANGQPVDGPAETAGTCSWASGQDVIRSGFLYKLPTVVPVGQSDLDLPGSSAPTPSPFDNAREPLAQFFKPVGHPNSDGFAVIVNHFKSKGDSSPAAAGDNANDPLVGAFNGDRTRQATELLTFANAFAATWNTTKVFLVGDFNAYTHEDPVQKILSDPLNTLGFDLVTSDDPDDLTYVFTTTVDGVGYGGAGSLDHVFASADAQAMITGTDVWEINSNEPGAYNYSRFNTNKTDFWDDTVPFAGSDHNPEIIGIDVPDNDHPVRDIQIIGSNDFHGRLLASSSDGGAAQLSGAVQSLKATWGASNSTFVAAGDLIGASTFESFVQKDKPTLEALNAAGLEVSAVGNHEFDQGYTDLLDRVMKPYDPDTNPYGAAGGLNWQYIGSNVVWDHDPDGVGPQQAGDPIVLPTWTKDFGDGITIGFVGAVTEDLLSLVNPAGMQGVQVTPIAQAVNGYATSLKNDGADVVVLLVHEGAPSTDCSTMTQGDSAFAELLGDINPDIDAVISGHTHLEYSCSFPVPEWSAKPIRERPVVSAGQYGVALDQLVYSFDTATGDPVALVSNNIGVKGPGSTLFSYPEDPAVKQIVDDAVAASAGPGAQVLGQISGSFKRARLSGGVTENRGGESTLGNLVAEIQRWATPESNGIDPAQIAFMNPGGLRDDLNGTGDSFPKDVTYKQAAAVQPFANTLVNLDLTGAQIREVLEQQWQRDAGGNVPSRPFLRLGTSTGFTYTYDETEDEDHPGATLGHVTGMWLNGEPISDTATYSVTMNSFLAAGGDNFRAFTQGSDKRDTGITDLQAQVDYMADNASETPLEVDYGQHALRVTFPADAPATYASGDTVTFDVASLAMTAPGDEQDTTVEAVINGEELGSFSVDNTAGTQPFDEAGTASVSVTLPSGLPDGSTELHLIGETTGTDVIVAIPTDDGLSDTTVSADDVSVPVGQDAQVTVEVDPTDAEGTVSVLDGATVLGTATLASGSATVTIPADQVPAMGDHELTLSYSGQPGAYSPSTGTFTLTVGKALTTTSASDVGAEYGQPVPVLVTVTGAGPTPSGTVQLFDGLLLLGNASLGTDGTATITVPAKTFPVGSKSLTVVYSGDSAHEGSQGSVTVTTSKASSITNAPDVDVPAGAQGTGTVTVTADNVTPTGTVTIKDGGTTVASAQLQGGQASFTLPVLADGTSLTAAYSGDDNVAASSDTFTIHVSKVASTTSATVKPIRPKAGQAVELKITVTGAGGILPTGTVTVTVNGATRTVTLQRGKATAELGRFPRGAYQATVFYNGDNRYAGSQTTVTFTVS